MPASTISCAVRGVTGIPVTVEADVANGLPNFTIVGLTDRAIQEARERVRAAVRNAGFTFPQRRVTINLAPAEVPKEGTCFDLAIALALLSTTNCELQLGGVGFLGELTLDGGLRPVVGVLPMARCLRDAGVRELVVAEENAGEAALVEGIRVIPVPGLRACVEHLDGSSRRPAARPSAPLVEPPADIDLAFVRGQASAKRVLEVAAVGGHNVLLLGPPGSGKTMLARTFASILPDLPMEAALEVAAVYSLRGALRERPPTSVRPPFRAPHHSVSRAGLIGGGMGLAQPGEISLAHRGVLFLDEVCEFPRTHLEALRQPLEEHSVAIARSRGSVLLPARFTLIAAANPCPCGHLGDGRWVCRCEPRDQTRYQARLSGPVRDRIDLVVGVPRQHASMLFGDAEADSSALVRARVQAARELRARRNRGLIGPGALWPARRSTPAGVPTGRALIDECRPTADALAVLQSAAEQCQLSARACFRVLRVARSIADLAGVDRVGRDAVAEALRYRGESVA